MFHNKVSNKRDRIWLETSSVLNPLAFNRAPLLSMAFLSQRGQFGLNFKTLWCRWLEWKHWRNCQQRLQLGILKTSAKKVCPKCICSYRVVLGVAWPCLESDMSFTLHDFAISNERRSCRCRSVTVWCIRHTSNAISVFFSAKQAGQWAHGYICFYFPCTPLITITTANHRLYA